MERSGNLACQWPKLKIHQGPVGQGWEEWKWGEGEKLQFSCGNLFEIEVGENIAQRVLRRLMSTDSPPRRETEGALLRSSSRHHCEFQEGCEDI